MNRLVFLLTILSLNVVLRAQTPVLPTYNAFEIVSNTINSIQQAANGLPYHRGGQTMIIAVPLQSFVLFYPSKLGRRVLYTDGPEGLVMTMYENIDFAQGYLVQALRTEGGEVGRIRVFLDYNPSRTGMKNGKLETYDSDPYIDFVYPAKDTEAKRQLVTNLLRVIRLCGGNAESFNQGTLTREVKSAHPALKNAEEYFKRAANAKDDLDSAVADYTAGLALEPEQSAALAHRGDLLRKQADPDGALKDYDRAIQLQPERATFHMRRGYALMDLDEWDKARASFTRAIELDHKSVYAYTGRAYAEAATGDFAAAIADYSGALELDTLNPDIVSARAMVCARAHRWTDALTDFRRAYELKAKPGETMDRDFAEIMIWVMRAHASELAIASQEIADYARKPSTRDRWTDTLLDFMAGHMTEEQLLALIAPGDATELAGRHCEAFYYAGVKRLAMGDREGASYYFQQSRASGQRNYVEYTLAGSE